MPNGDIPILSPHAKKRWEERCAGIDLKSEWYLSRRAGKNVRRKIRDSCPAHRHLTAGRTYRGFWYMVGRNRVVFVVKPDTNTIVTVWRI